MDSLLQACRENFGAAPRRLSLWERRYFYPSLPNMSAGDQLNPLQKARHRLLKRGRLVWSAIVRDAGTLTEPDELDDSVVLIWSEDASWARDALSARIMARQVDALRTGSHTTEFMQIGRMIRSATDRPFNYLLPASFGPRLYLTSTIVFRTHLPSGFLTTDLLPLLVLPEETPYSLILPGKFWPDELKDG